MNLIRGVRCSAAWRRIRVGYISGVVGAVEENYWISRIFELQLSILRVMGLQD